MNKIIGIFASALILLASCSQPSVKTKLANENDTVSYYLGLYWAKGLKQSDLKQINPAAVAMAFDQVFKDDSIKITDEEIRMKLNAYFMKLTNEASQENLKKGKEFLDNNKKNPKIVELPSGLQYEVIKEGTGPKPDSTDVVSVNYTGTFIDGKEFDSSIKRGEPAKFPVTGVIPGWTEALLHMNVGSKWKLYIPSNLAYGEQGSRNGQIKPNSTLIFEVELLSVEPKTDSNKK